MVQHESQLPLKCAMEIVWAFCFALAIVSQIYAQVCQEQCYCPWAPQRCAPGVPLVLDGCGCCKICARQFGQACNQVHVCQRDQGLFCDYTASYPGRGGVCNYEDDGSCEIDGKTYKNGEVFQPSCKTQCRCSDGGSTCTPLCSEDIQLPTPECPFPRRVEVPGKCCPTWVCDSQENRITRDNAIASRPRHEVASQPMFHTCVEWSTEWDACSTSCGMGVSLRVSNKNPYCRLETQSRLCMVRPCQDHGITTNVRLSRCKETVRPSPWIHFEFQSCVSVKVYQPTYCGFCGSRQCRPYHTREDLVDFNCNGERTIRKLMMFIISCVCH